MSANNIHSKNQKKSTKSEVYNYCYESPGINQTDISEAALHVIEGLQTYGYKAFIVGGAVRDLLIGLKPKDFDVATNATPEQVVQVFRRARIIGKRFQIVHVRARDSREIIEVTTFRGTAQKSQTVLLKNSEQRKQSLKHIETGKKFAVNEDGQILSDNMWGTHEEDASRRDLSINALYYDPFADVLYDFYHGQADLQAKLIKMIGDPWQRYTEDPMRMLRVARFQAKTGFDIDADTQQAIFDLNHLIKNIPKARLLDEFAKILLSGAAASCIYATESLGLASFIFPWHHHQYNTYQKIFISLALQRSDERLAEYKTVSLSFIFACIFWGLVENSWQTLKTEYEHSFIALEQAIFRQQYAFKDITHKLLADMHDIWLFQGRLEKRSKHTCLDMLVHPRFKAGFDFLELRVTAMYVYLEHIQQQNTMTEADSQMLELLNVEYQSLLELFNWWKSFAQADDKQTILATLVNTKNLKQRARRKRKKNSEDEVEMQADLLDKPEVSCQIDDTANLTPPNTEYLSRDDYPIWPDYKPEHKNC